MHDTMSYLARQSVVRLDTHGTGASDEEEAHGEEAEEPRCPGSRTWREQHRPKGNEREKSARPQGKSPRRVTRKLGEGGARIVIGASSGDVTVRFR
jgi:hypothetical protein